MSYDELGSDAGCSAVLILEVLYRARLDDFNYSSSCRVPSLSLPRKRYGLALAISCAIKCLTCVLGSVAEFAQLLK